MRSGLPNDPNVHRSLAALSACCLFVSIFLFLRSYGAWRQRPSSLSIGCRSDPTLVSELLGGIPGFYVFENVWFRNGTFRLYNPFNASFPDSDKVFSLHAELEVSPTSPPDVVSDFCFEGTTLLIHEVSTLEHKWTGLYHYYHFVAEDLLGGLTALASVPVRTGRALSTSANGVVIPWQSGWKDVWGMNEMVLRGMFDNHIVDTDHWHRLIKGDRWVYFARVAVVDRWASHEYNVDADVWNKMALPIFQHPHIPDFFTPPRERLLEHYNIRKTEPSVSKVIYIDRQASDRRMSDQNHEELLQMLVDLDCSGVLTFEHLVLEDMEPIEQVRAVADASVMIGIHGNGLTHQLWMSTKSTLIELFPTKSFLRDYQAVATVLGHNYWAVQNDTVFTDEDMHRYAQDETGERLHDGTVVQLHVPFIRDLVELLIGS